MADNHTPKGDTNLFLTIFSEKFGTSQKIKKADLFKINRHRLFEISTEETAIFISLLYNTLGLPTCIST